MNHWISLRTQALTPSATLALAAKAKALKQEGHAVINFGAGEPAFDTPEGIRAAAKRALDEGQTRYTPEDGTLELKDALIESIRELEGHTYRREEIGFSNGGKQAIFNLMMATLNPLDEVVIPTPYWVSFPEIVRLAGGRPVPARTRPEDGYKLTVETLRPVFTPRTRWIILNSPNNPTGQVYSATELGALLEFLAPFPDVLILSDETYARLTFDGVPFVSPFNLLPELKDRVFRVGSFSKSYAMTGWRLGYALGSADVLAACKLIQGQTTSNPNSIAQAAAITALRSHSGDVERFRLEFEKRRNVALSRLAKLPRFSALKPAGAFYLFIDCSQLFTSSLPTSRELSLRLLGESRVVVVPGTEFGMPSHIRLSFCPPEAEIHEGFDRIGRFIEELLSFA